ncbi:MAG TPA: DNA gyrase C-terminal beta-propeller domain-containing protein, partial [Polyangiaceae bacterium]|nr:DNA gyrase C-terminal beta-propeller domain-containing protein [Polyangiaceae bacterium]
TDGNQEFLIATKQGQSIRFHEQQVRPMGRNAGGVKAIELESGDEVVGLARTEPERTWVLAVCERGYGKRTALEEFRAQNRGGKGIILIDASDRNGPVVGIALVKPEDEIMLITDRGQTIRTPVDGVRETGRNAQGVKLMSVGDDERVVAFEPIGESSAGAVLDGGSIPPEAGDEGEVDGTGEGSDGGVGSGSIAPTSGENGAGGDGEPEER